MHCNEATTEGAELKPVKKAAKSLEGGTIMLIALVLFGPGKPKKKDKKK